MIHTCRAQIDKNDREKVYVLGPFHDLSSPNEKHSMARRGHRFVFKKVQGYENYENGYRIIEQREIVFIIECTLRIVILYNV